MSYRSASRAVAAAVLLATLTASCGAPPDEALLRFLGFRPAGGTTSLSLVTGKLRDGTTDGADAEFENASSTVGRTSGGTGVLLYRARVQYRMSGFAPPVLDLPLTLYLDARASTTDATAAATTGTVSDLPLATASLKHWLIQTHAFEDTTLNPTVELHAVVTFFAVTDEGEELETTGAIAISLDNSN
jgi:hypothetical protein